METTTPHATTLDDTTTHPIHEQVRRRYAAAARAAAAGRTASCADAPTLAAGPSAGCCGAPTSTADQTGAADQASGCCGATTGGDGCCEEAGGAGTDPFGAANYSAAELELLPAGARAASLGCGNPLLVADLHEGETVLDLGSGAGGDALLSSRRVGPTGRVHGLDLTDEMLALARRNAAEAGASNVEFHKGHIEDIPLPDASVDVIISNCVINLSPDKPAVFAQMHRVLRPGGRIGVSDVVAEDRLTPAQRAERGSWAGCVAGALSRTEYAEQLAAAGFVGVEVTFTHEVADGLHAAIVKAARP